MPRKITLPPPPTANELAFQEFQFDERLQRSTQGLQTPLYVNSLGASFFGTHGRDMSITGQFAERLRNAGNVLR